MELLVEDKVSFISGKISWYSFKHKMVNVSSHILDNDRVVNDVNNFNIQFSYCFTDLLNFHC